MIEKKQLPSQYIVTALDALCLGGDAYVSEDALFKKCKILHSSISYEGFRADLSEQIHAGKIQLEGSRIYDAKTWRYEESAARSLSGILGNPFPYKQVAPAELVVNGIALCEEQRNAVALALSNRLTIILGGAGCGKSTLIRAIVNRVGAGKIAVLCAPTGKAARNLTSRTGLPARTIHSALGLHPDEDLLGPVSWNQTDLVIVDEASMMTLEMLAGILHRVKSFCRVVLLGDPNQLLSVGSGNVLPDLLALGLPCARLKTNHRQEQAALALTKNVVEFSSLRYRKDLAVGEDFAILPLRETEIEKELTKEAVRRYLSGEAVQVLSPYNRATQLSVRNLNYSIRNEVNPLTEKTVTISFRSQTFRDGDRVMILQNDRDRNCSNGDVGVLHILKVHEKCASFCVLLPDGRMPVWEGNHHLALLTLAYALTVHKSQGSEYDMVLFPVSTQMYSMLSRNLFYTAISRARKRVILYGSEQAIDVAMQRQLPERKSLLVAKTHMHMSCCA